MASTLSLVLYPEHRVLQPLDDLLEPSNAIDTLSSDHWYLDGINPRPGYLDVSDLLIHINWRFNWALVNQFSL